jgi:hypothetical protein
LPEQEALRLERGSSSRLIKKVKTQRLICDSKIFFIVTSLITFKEFGTLPAVEAPVLH